MSSADVLAQERDAKFKVWLQNKSLKEKAFEYLGKLESDRATEEDSLVEVAVSLCAVDRLLGNEEDKLAAVQQAASQVGGSSKNASGVRGKKGAATAAASNNVAPPPAKKSLRSAWFRWAMEFHTFSMIHLSQGDVAGLSGAVKEFLFSEADIVASSGEGGDAALEKASREKNILPSLRYSFPQVPKPNEKAKPLTQDQRAQNAIWMREARALWRRAQEELNARVVEFVAKKMKGGKSGTSAGPQSSQRQEEEERKGKAAHEEGKGGDMDDEAERGGEDIMHPEDRMLKMRRLETVCLQELSLKQLRAWLEEDEEARASKANEDAMEKLKMAKSSHEQFVKKKDSLRIRLPDNLKPLESGAMGYGREVAGVRAATKSAASTVDMMAGLGLKYVHATNRGRKGQIGDLEKSRAQLLKMGFVDRTNFDEEEQEAYRKERRDNQVVRERQEQEARMKEENSKAYDEWVAQKEMRDQALRCLKLLPKPALDQDGGGGDTFRIEGTTTATVAAVRHRASHSSSAFKAGAQATAQGAAGGAADPALQQHCIAVGRALKRVDRSLFLEWARWCDAVFSINTATVVWDALPPKACDVHSPAYSQVRDTFLKLLKPGLDYRQTFVDFVEGGVLARKEARYKAEKDYYRLRDDAREEVDEEIEALRKEWLAEVALSKKDLYTLLRQMGIAMKEPEMRALIDAFDANGDGVITLGEFLEFTGPKRDRRGGSSMVMSQRCCWLTTCKVTGMANGYSVSAATHRALKMEAARKQEELREARSSSMSKGKGGRSSSGGGGYEDDDDFEDDDQERQRKERSSKLGVSATAGSRIGGDGPDSRVVLRKLANGDTRMCVELQERRRREELLRRLQILPPQKGEAASKKAADDGGGGDDEYDDEFHDDEEDEGAAGAKGRSAGRAGGESKENTGTGGAGVFCEYAHWSLEERRKGLRFLLEASKEQREQETLKTLLANGVPPFPPKFWIEHEKPLETRSKNRTLTRRGEGRGGDRGSQDGSLQYSDDDEEYDDEDDDDGAPRRSGAGRLGYGASSTTLTLFWGPEKGDLVSFYSLEFGGAVGAGPAKGAAGGSDVLYSEIFRDPEDADPSREFSFRHTVRGLVPGGSYRFRIRAFNGFGAGEYTYKTFTTMTAAPALPRVIKVASDSATLKWTFSKGFFKRLAELKRLFMQADADRSGMVSREELAAVLDEHAQGSPALRVFIGRVAAGMGLDVAQGYDALFDMIEGDDDGGLSWDEFETFFMAAGWGTAPSVPGTASQATMKTSTSAAVNANAVAISPGDISYVVERCENEIDGSYKEAVRTTLGHATVKGLEPGKSYRFRLRSLNADGVPGPYSPCVLVHTLLETPLAPVPKSVGAHKVLLSWRARNIVTSTRNKAFVDKMLGDWSGGQAGDGDAGVSIEAAFNKYDKNGSGDIDSAELQAVLEDLGVDTSEERLNEAFDLLDKNQDGVISYEEFSKWWRRDEVTYTLKRSEEVVPRLRPLTVITDSGNSTGVNKLLARLTPVAEEASLSGTGDRRSASRGKTRPRSAGAMARTTSAGIAAAGAGTRAGAAVGGGGGGGTAARQVGVPIVTYRGEKTRCEVMGLTPNRLYHFKVRYVGSRSNSMLSPPLLLMSLPLPPCAPIVVGVTASSVRLKFYPGPYGAFKFAVHLRQVDGAAAYNRSSNRTLNYSATSSSKEGAARRMNTTTLKGTDTGEDGWVAMYCGLENVYTCTTLASETAYEARVFGVNCQGALSEASETVSFTTKARDDRDAMLVPKHAASVFSIECTGDICVGDTILITERLYRRQKDGAVSDGSGIRESRQSLPGGAGPTSSKTLNRSRAGGTRTGAGAGAKSGGFDGGNHSMTMSVTSLMGAGGASITAAPGAFLGERTIAAYVARDNYRTIRHSLAQGGVEPRHTKKFGVHRRLWLEVVWQRSSNDACKPYDLKTGEVLERIQGHLEQFEVFRGRWDQEELRRPLQEEWSAMIECYVQTDCT